MTLPLGFVVKLTRHTRVEDSGRALLGGSPTRMLYLTEAAAAMLVSRTVTVVNASTAVLADRLLDRAIADPVIDALEPVGAAEDGGSRVTYVIPVRDRPSALARLLASIGPGQTVIVVDDCSLDGGAVAAVATAHGARIVTLPVNVGPGGARNAGLRLVRTPFVVFVDSDVVVDACTVPTLLKHFADPKVAMVAPRIVGLADVATANWIGRYEDARSALDLGSFPATVRPRSAVSWASTACAVARVDALGDGFTPGMRIGEDVDLVWTLVERGWRVRYEPAAQARHEHRVRPGDWITRRVMYGTGAHPLAQRHPRAIAPAILAPWSAAVIVALLAQRRWSLPVAGGISAATAGRIAWRLRRSEHPLRIGTWLTANGVVSAVAQAMALMLRHWWPLAALGCVFSSRMRRAVLVAGVLDVALRYRPRQTKLDPVRFGIAVRLDDLAYGTGVWLSAVKGRSLAALLPAFVNTGRRSRESADPGKRR